MGTSSDETVSRRGFLAASGVLLATTATGCLEGRDPATVEASAVASDDEVEVEIIDDSRTIEPGDFYGWQFELDWEHEVDYTVEVTEGSDVNVYIIEDDELDALRDGEDFRAVDEAIWSEVNSVTDSVVLGEGSYWLVAINADREAVNA